MSYLFQIFRRHSWDVSAVVQHNFRFLVCLSVCSLPHYLTDIMLTVDISSSGGTSFFKFSEDISWILVQYFKIIQDFLYVCLSVHCLTYLLILCYQWISPVLDELAFSNFLETFLGCLYTSSI